MQHASTTKVKRIALGALSLGYAVAVAVLAFSYVSVVDDAYISFRYSHNLVKGEGLVFNSGEYVEGYSNLLWTLLMAIPEAAGVPIRLAAAYTGLCFALLALLVTWKICLRLRLSSWGTLAAVITLGGYPEFWLAATMGLEGGLFAFLLALSVFLLISGKAGGAGLLGGLMFATRPESVLLMGVFALYMRFAVRDRRGLVALLVPWLGLVAAITLWRLYYYGAWLPNTITAKAPPERSLETLWQNAVLGMRYLGSFLLSASPLVVGALLGALLGVRNRAVTLLCLGALAAEVPAVLVGGGDWMLNHRLLSVYAPLLAVSLGVAADRLLTSARLPKFAPVIAITVLAALCAFVPRGVWWDQSPDAEVASAEPCWEDIAEAANPVLRSSEDVVALEVLGVFSYKNPDVYAIDVFGLTDRRIARQGTYYVPRFGKMDFDYTYSLRPELILTHIGPDFFELLEGASSGGYEREYNTYVLDPPDAAERCAGKEFAAGIRKDVAGRILPAFSPFSPKVVEVP